MQCLFQYLEDVWIHGTDGGLLHWILVMTIKVVKEVDIVKGILAFHGKVNAVLTKNDI